MHEDIPRVSLALPVYNGEEYLGRALDSLLDQSFRDFELVISDNGSSDGTEDMCRIYAARDSRIRYFRHAENRGIAWNFNEAFRLSRGAYFKWAAHDDVCEATFLEKAVEVLDREPGVILCFSEVGMINRWGDEIGDANDAPSGSRRNFDDLQTHKRYGDVLLHCAFGIEFYGLIRRDVLGTTGLLRPYCLGEKVLIAELALRGRFHQIPERLLYWRRHEKQLTHIASIEQRRLVANPRVSRRHVLPYRTESTLGYLSIIGPWKVGLGQSVLCTFVFARYLLQVRKWKRVVRAAWTGMTPRKIPSVRQKHPDLASTSDSAVGR